MDATKEMVNCSHFLLTNRTTPVTISKIRMRSNKMSNASRTALGAVKYKINSKANKTGSAYQYLMMKSFTDDKNVFFLIGLDYLDGSNRMGSVQGVCFIFPLR